MNVEKPSIQFRRMSIRTTLSCFLSTKDAQSPGNFEYRGLPCCYGSLPVLDQKDQTFIEVRNDVTFHFPPYYICRLLVKQCSLWELRLLSLFYSFAFVFSLDMYYRSLSYFPLDFGILPAVFCYDAGLKTPLQNQCYHSSLRTKKYFFFPRIADV